MKRVLLWSFVLLLAVASSAWSAPLTSNRHIFINVANDAGVKYNLDGAVYGGPDNTYYIKADGGGLNAESIGATFTDTSKPATTKTTSSPSVSGSLYLFDQGGTGYVQDIILLVSVQGSIAGNFGLTITSSGYADASVGGTYQSGVLNEAFTKSDFIYGPQTARPGPGALGVWSLPFYPGQDITDATTAATLMFVDLDVGAIKNNPVEVDYSFTNFYGDVVAFNMYGWNPSGNQGEGITWTNPSYNGYVITDTATAPVPVPPSLFLLAGGLGGLGMFRRNRAKRG